MKIVHKLDVTKVERESPFVRVEARFMEGRQSHGFTKMTFLCQDHEAPRIGDTLTVTIEDEA